MSRSEIALEPLEVLQHWQMIQHLCWEVFTQTWPYAEPGHPYHRDRCGFKQLFDYAKVDPRFIAAGLRWHQPPCAFYYRRWRDIEAVGHFMGQHVGLGRFGHQQLNNWFNKEVKGGPLRVYVEQQLVKAWKIVDPERTVWPKNMDREFDFMDPRSYAEKTALTEFTPYDSQYD